MTIEDQDRFDACIESLYKDKKHLAAEVTKLGYPNFCDSIPTAGVAWDSKRNRISFLFNRKFWNKLNDEQLKFIVCHEAYHFIFGHIFLLQDDNRNSFTKIDKSKVNRYKLNIAMDCVVNDGLVNWYKFNRMFHPDDEPKFDFDGNPLTLYYGKPTVKMDCHDMTAEDVYWLLPDDTDGSSCNHDMWDSFFDNNGNLKQEFVDKIKEFVERNQSSSHMSDQEMRELDKMKEKIKNARGLKAGNQQFGSLRPVENTGKTLKWDMILLDFVDTRKVEDAWNKPNRKLSAFYPDTILPYSKDAEVQEILVFVDSSGSIDHNALNLFISLIKNTPKHIKVRAVSFDTTCYEFDLIKEQPKGGGGTNFGILQSWIDLNCKKYPKCVIVLTDGEGSECSNIKNPNRWMWLLYGSSCELYCKNMRRHKIDDLIVR